MKYLKLFIEFFKIGLFTFGGGLAMIPMMEKAVVDKHNWMTSEEIIDMIAISEATPGALGINVATFIGYRVGKIRGALVSTFAVILPSFIIVVIISLFYEAFMQIEVVKWAFLGIKAGICALILSACIKLFKKAPHNLFSIAIMILAIEIALFTSIQTIWIIVGGLILGLLFYSILYHTDQKNKEKDKVEKIEGEK